MDPGKQMNRPIDGLSIVIPVHNEEENIEPLRAGLLPALLGTGLPFEILFIDDGSTDGSPDLLRRIAAADPRFRVIRLPRRSGQSAAFDAGFRRCRFGVVVTLDADLQNDPADIPAFLAAMRETGADVVCGVRLHRHDSLIRRISSRIANRVRDWITGDSITDTGCSLKAYRIEFLRRLKMYDGMHRFLPTLLRLEGASVIEVPATHRARLAGRSKYGIRNRALRGLRDCLAVRWMRDRRLAYTVDDPMSGETPAVPETDDGKPAGTS